MPKTKRARLDQYDRFEYKSSLRAAMKARKEVIPKNCGTTKPPKKFCICDRCFSIAFQRENGS